MTISLMERNNDVLIGFENVETDLLMMAISRD